MSIQLDEATQNAINALSRDASQKSYAFGHEILFYGLEAVAHYHIMHMAMRIPGEIQPIDFIEKYELLFKIDPKSYCPELATPQFTGRLASLTKDGIFIPHQAYDFPGVRHAGKITFFDGDYRNRMRNDSWLNKLLGHALIGRIWRAEDLQDTELVSQGIEFSRDLWRTCVWGFNYYKNGVTESSIQPQPEYITELGERLLEYYSSLILGEMQS